MNILNIIKQITYIFSKFVMSYIYTIYINSKLKYLFSNFEKSSLCCCVSAAVWSVRHDTANFYRLKKIKKRLLDRIIS